MNEQQELSQTQTKLDDALATLDEAMKLIKVIATKSNNVEEKQAALKFLNQVKYF